MREANGFVAAIAADETRIRRELPCTNVGGGFLDNLLGFGLFRCRCLTENQTRALKLPEKA